MNIRGLRIARRFRIGLVGCGYIAENVHLPLLTNSRNAKLVAICDTDKEKARRASKTFGIPAVYDRVNEMIERERPDIVDICTPPDAHVTVARGALEMGCHCILEKPMTVNVDDADELIKTSKEKNLGLFVLHNYSYVPCIRNARHAIASGKLGRVILAETRYYTSLQRERYYAADHWIHKLPGGVLSSEILPHLLMLILDFVGVVAESKVLTMKRSDLSYVVADELKMTMTSASKAIGYVGLSFNSPVLYHTTDIICEQGALFVDHGTGTVVHRKSPGLVLTDREAGSAVSRGSWALQEIFQKSAGFVTVAANTALGRYRLLAEGHRFLFEECFRALKSSSEYPVSLEKCREVVRLLESVSFHVGQTSAKDYAKSGFNI